MLLLIFARHYHAHALLLDLGPRELSPKMPSRCSERSGGGGGSFFFFFFFFFFLQSEERGIQREVELDRLLNSERTCGRVRVY